MSLWSSELRASLQFACPHCWLRSKYSFFSFTMKATLLVLTVGSALDILSSSSLWKQHHFSASVSWIQAGPPNPLASVTVGAQKVEAFYRLPKNERKKWQWRHDWSENTWCMWTRCPANVRVAEELHWTLSSSGDLEQALQEGCSNAPGVGGDRCPQFQTGMPCSFSAAGIETCTRTPRQRHLLLSPMPGGSTPRRDSRVQGASAEEDGADRWHGTGLRFVSWIINRFLPTISPVNLPCFFFLFQS